MNDIQPTFAGFRRILGLVRRYWPLLVLASVLSVVGAVLALVVPLGLRSLVNAVFEQGSRQLLDRLALLLGGLFVLQATITFAGRYLLTWLGERIVADFRTLVFTHLQRLSPRFFDDRKTGELTSRLASDVAAVRTALTDSLSEFITGTLRLAGCVVMLMVINWRLSVLVLVAVPTAAALSRVFAVHYARISRTVQDRMAETAAIAQEAISLIRVVTAFGRQRYETERYRQSVEALFGVARRRAVLVSLFAAAVSGLFFVAIAAIFWLGGVEVLAGRLTAGDLVAVLIYAMMLSTAIGGLTAHYSAFAGALGASARLFELLDTQPEVADRPGAGVLNGAAGALRFEDVTFSYEPDNPVLRDVSLVVAPGETVAVVGASGAGKSTLLNLVCRFYDPVGGRVLLDGVDLRDIRLDSLREQIAVVSQDVQLFNDTLENNIRYGRLDATPEEVRRAARLAHADEFIRQLPCGYETLVGERGVKLSGGQRQRIAIARAVLKDAPILLLDEATSALDSESETLVKDALRRLMDGRTSLVVAHRLATVRDADRILVIQEGRVSDVGTHAQLVERNPVYRGFALQQFGTAAAAN